nr:MAG TPA: docking domain containing protein [Caudoviricetes sp.]
MSYIKGFSSGCVSGSPEDPFLFFLKNFRVDV